MKKITFLMICLMTITFSNAQLTSVAIVGDGAGGWPTGAAGEVDVNQMTTTDNENWTINDLTMTVGSVKFRGNNAWTLPYNWGGTTFPNGTATVDGPGITSAPGIYDVAFNSTTGVYTFTAQTGVFPLISLVGPAAGGWEADLDMATADGINYSLSAVHLLAGAVKWRQDHAWTNNWGPGSSTYPSGTAVYNDGGAVTIPVEGYYNATFNLNTLEFTFSFPTVAIVGSATPSGWPTGAAGEVDPHQLATQDGITYTMSSIDLTTNPAKFRANNSWAQNWGSTAWPTGTGVQDGADIPVTAGTYGITFNRLTGAYVFGAPLAVGQFDSAMFKVYPNPTQNVWNFSATSETIETIKVLDMTGKTVLLVTPQTAEVNVDASALSSGMYFATVQTRTGSATLKLIKK